MDGLIISKSNNQDTCTCLFSLQEYVELYAIVYGICAHVHIHLHYDFILQELQDAQEAQEANVSVIDQSGHNEEMQRALAQNPDISKERNNQLQGNTYM